MKIFRASQNFGSCGYSALSSIVFYSMTFLILLAIPVTVILVRSEREQVSRASKEFNNPPIINLIVEPLLVSTGEKVKVNVDISNANWYAIYFISGEKDYQLIKTHLQGIKSRFSSGENLLLIHEGSKPEEFSFAPNKTGYIVGIAYQLSNYLANFQSSDVMCAWDGNVYTFREKVNLVNEIFGNNTSEGDWEQLIRCINSGAVHVVIN